MSGRPCPVGIQKMERREQSHCVRYGVEEYVCSTYPCKDLQANVVFGARTVGAVGM